MKRTTVKLTCPNPLFELWLQEWKDEAASRNSELEHVFGKALTSLKKYPLPLKSGRDCLVLENFGTRICLQLDHRLAEHRKLRPEDSGVYEKITKELEPPKPKKARQKSKEINGPKDKIPESGESSSNKKQYIPAWRSAAYGILIALYNESTQNNTTAEMRKEELLQAAQRFTDTSMYKPLPGSFYTGWSSASQLVKKNLVLRKGNPPKFSLTDKGLSLAKQLPNFDLDCSYDTTVLNTSSVSPNSISTELPSKYTIDNNKLLTKKPVLSPTKTKRSRKKAPELEVCPPRLGSMHEVNLEHDHNPVTTSSPINRNSKSVKDKEMDRCSQSSSQSEVETVIFMPKSFEVILLVDTQELMKGDEMVKELRACGSLVEVRKLKVGDFLWVCRNSSNQEIVLPYIIERKRLDDLAKSIKDGRFHEQKFRLKQCGIPNCIYLVEKHVERHYSLPLTTLLQAATNTQVIDNFVVKFTAGHRESVIYLSHLTAMFTNMFANKTLISCEKTKLPDFSIQEDCASLMTFSDFSKTSGKFRVFRIREMFVRQLVQLRGLSVEKALSVVEKYPTPRHLIQAYRDGGDEKMLAEIKCGPLRRNLGIALSTAIYQLYNNRTLK